MRLLSQMAVSFLAATSFLCCPMPAVAQSDASASWAVRMVESEMARNPEAWQLDFQPKLKWDYCHGLELRAFLYVAEKYSRTDIRDYAISYADTMVNADGTIKKYKLTDYSLDRINSGKYLLKYMTLPEKPVTRKLSICYAASLKNSLATTTAVSGIKRCIPIKCGSMGSTWVLPSLPSMLIATRVSRCVRPIMPM